MDMQPENQTASMPTLCKGNCGFYGSSATEGLCSKCFKDALNRKQDPNRQAAGASLFPATTSSSSSLNSAHEINPNEFLKAKTFRQSPASSNPELSSTQTSDEMTPKPCAASHAQEKMPIETQDAGSPVQPSSSSSTTALVAPCSTLGASASAPSLGATSAPVAPAEPPKLRTRCETCNKKVGFTGFECRCGGMFCGAHRYSDMHACPFDYKSLGAEEIKKNNPVIAKEKIEKL